MDKIKERDKLKAQLKKLDEEIEAEGIGRLSALDQYKGRWFLSDGCEDGGIIFKVNEFKLNEDGEIVFDGPVIYLKTINSDSPGIALEVAEGYRLVDLHYFYYFKGSNDIELEEAADDVAECSVNYASAYFNLLEKNDLDYSREIAPNELETIIKEHLSYTFEDVFEDEELTLFDEEEYVEECEEEE